MLACSPCLMAGCLHPTARVGEISPGEISRERDPKTRVRLLPGLGLGMIGSGHGLDRERPIRPAFRREWARPGGRSRARDKIQTAVMIGRLRRTVFLSVCLCALAITSGASRVQGSPAPEPLDSDVVPALLFDQELVSSELGLAPVPSTDPDLVEGAGGGIGASVYRTGVMPRLAYSLAHGVTLNGIPLETDQLQTWLPFGLPLETLRDSHVAQVGASPPIISDGQFVWGPSVGDFDIRGYLEILGSPLAAYADDIALWADYSSVNPEVLLAVLQMRYDLVIGMTDGHDPDQVRAQIGQTAVDLANAFYEHLYTWGSRRPQPSRPALSSPVIHLGDGSIAVMSTSASSGTYALAAILGASGNC